MQYPKYYLHHSVRNYREASLFSRPETWEIFDILHTEGVSGIRAEDIHSNLERRFNSSVSRSKVYSLLKQLYEGNWLKRHYSQERNAQVYTIDNHWGGWGDKQKDDNFDEAVKEIASSFIEGTIFPVFEEYLKKVSEELITNNQEKWIPANKNNFCNECHFNHSAEEFFNSLLDIATMEFLESNRFRELLIKNKYCSTE